MAKTKSLVKYQREAPVASMAAGSGSNTNDLKIIRMLIKAQEKRENTLLARQILASPLVQMIGTVFAAELAEKADLISPSWAGAIEGGMVTMVGLQAIKEYGLIPGGAMLSAMGMGAIAGSPDELPGGYSPWDFAKDWLAGALGLGAFT